MQKSLTLRPCLQAATALAAIAGFSFLPFGASAASDTANEVRLSLGASLQSRNDVQIPNSDAGTRFSLADEVDEESFTAIRFEFNREINERHGLRVMLAPLSYSEPVSFDAPVNFEGENFSANQETEASYTFNSWRVGYHYTLRNSGTARYRVGATLKVRDAEIRLEQGDTIASNDDIGLVPLLYLNARFQLAERLSLTADLDALGGGPGRAIDAGFLLDYSISPRWQLGMDLRVLDGGADIDELFNFARFDSASIALSARF